MTIPSPRDADPLPTDLGPRVPKPQSPTGASAPLPVPDRPGILRSPDGKLSTDLPFPAARLFSAPGEYDVETW